MRETAIDRFSNACGATGPLSFAAVDHGEREGASWSFDQPFLRIGRDPDADLVLSHDQVGRRHCYLQRIGGRVFCVDLDSRTGTHLDGAPCRAGWLDPGRALQIGPVGFRLEGGNPVGSAALTGDRGPDWPSPLSARSGQRQPDLPVATLEIAGARGETQRWRMDPVLVLVGRSPACKLRSQSPVVSKFHCALLRTPDGVWLVDLLSRTGSFVQGIGVCCSWLDDGEVVNVGPFSIRVRYDSRPRPPGLQARLAQATASPRADLRERRAPAMEGAGERGLPGVVAPALTRALAQAVGPPHRGDSADLVRVLPGGDCGGWDEPPTPAQSDSVALMVLRMFVTVQHDQMALAREELALLHQLVGEVQALRSAWESRPATPVAALAAGPLPNRADAAPTSPTPPSLAPEAAQRDDGAPGGRPGMAPSARRDPREIEAIASAFLAAYGRERPGRWGQVLATLLGPPRGPGAKSAAGPAGGMLGEPGS